MEFTKQIQILPHKVEINIREGNDLTITCDFGTNILGDTITARIKDLSGTEVQPMTFTLINDGLGQFTLTVPRANMPPVGKYLWECDRIHSSKLRTVMAGPLEVRTKNE